MSGRLASTLAAAAVALIASSGHASTTLSETLTGTLATDDAVALFPLVLTQESRLDVSTDSYGGGLNLDGGATAAGGFVPIISLFSPTGVFIAEDGADVLPPGAIDPVTGVADDAAFSIAELGAGTYTLAVTEFYNYPNGNLSDGFFEAGQGNFTGPTCGQAGASFLQVNLVSRAQRSDEFVVNASATAVPEAPTYALLMLGFGALDAALRARRNSAFATG